MRIQCKRIEGSVLMSALVVTAIVGISLVSYLTISHAENRSTFRSQIWNHAFTVAEAGIEEAMTQLNFQGGENLTANGWTLINGKYTKQRTLDENSYYLSTIDDADLTIRSTGYTRLPPGDSYVSRTLQASVDTANSVFTQAIIAKNHIKFRAKNGADSYDAGSIGRGKSNNGNGNGGNSSTNSSSGKGATKGKGKKGPGSGGGTSGLQRGYDKNNFFDHFGLASPRGKKDSIKVDESKIYGSCQVAPSGSVKFNKNASVGSYSWITTGKIGMDPDRFGSNFRFTFPEVEPPFTGGATTPLPQKIDGVDYQYVLDTGNYLLGKVDLKQPILVRGDAVLYLTGSFKGDSDKDIVFQNTNCTLKIYCEGDHFHLKTKNTVNAHVPASFQYYGLPKNKCVKIDKGQDVACVIYAPRARVHLKGNGEFYGSVVGKCVHTSGDGKFHYDEALGRLYGDFEQFVITAWSEL